jgi:hypothetical protein
MPRSKCTPILANWPYSPPSHYMIVIEEKQTLKKELQRIK